MKFQLVSDLHIDFQLDWGRKLINTIKTPQVDVLIIAGDLAEAHHPSWKKALVELTAYYPDVLMILGNHEYYDSDPQIVQYITTKLSQEIPNLHVLENQTITLQGIKFAGTTLWFSNKNKNHQYEMFINDFRAIDSFEYWVDQRNKIAKEFLEEVDADVIITHHLPSTLSVAPRFQNHPLNRFFVSDVEDIIHIKQPQYWLHGHSHTPCNYQIGKTQVIANPYGYPQEDSNYNFVNHMVLEVN